MWPKESPASSRSLSHSPRASPEPRSRRVPRRIRRREPRGVPFPTCPTTPLPAAARRSTLAVRADLAIQHNWPLTEITDTCATHSLYAMFSCTAHHSLTGVTGRWRLDGRAGGGRRGIIGRCCTLPSPLASSSCYDVTPHSTVPHHGLTGSDGTRNVNEDLTR
ncbi:hypothetical protein DBV15_09732 [Temnothorax longispinosus]|uniref:Uncharacterized protein n=1 Tax=Temnothorax longispinosus TaxID=300112 RepID=A0A4S2KE53_9HYME|nr:hypothetical protein DBV15_09732 [Temnothorax longispinosus]